MVSNCFAFLSVLWGLVILLADHGFAQVIVSTKFGPVRGYQIPSRFGAFYTFKNIPYAKPPVDNLRFQRPIEPDKWFNVDEAKQERQTECPQFPYYATQRPSDQYFGQEDCLVLDVHTKRLPTLNVVVQLPVLVYFHPGLFSHGSKDEYGPDFLLKVGDILIVIPNYRLGILGFLSNNDSVLPGNLGLWDQRMVLQWVSENIRQFGGDPAKVTIAGHDAGGASVGFHMLSPRTQANLFKAAISGSGTALDIWATTQNPSQNAYKLAGHLHCSTKSSWDMISCLRYRPLDNILAAQKSLVNVTFRPVIDVDSNDSFIPEDPKILYNKGFYMSVPYLAGVTENEASVEVFRDFEEAAKEKHLDKIIIHYLRKYLPVNANLESITKAAKYHYLRGINIPDFISVAPKIAEMMSDFLYKSTLEQTLKLHSLRNQNTYMYVFNFPGMRRKLGNVFVPGASGEDLGVSHMEDVIYLFNTTFGNWISEDINAGRNAAMIDILTKIWRNFISLKTISLQQPWRPFNSTNNLNYMDISNTNRVLMNYRKNDTDFWTYLVPDLQSVTNTSIVSQSPELAKFQSATWGLTGLAVLLAVLCVALVGAVIVTRRRFTRSSILPVSTSQELSAKYSKI